MKLVDRYYKIRFRVNSYSTDREILAGSLFLHSSDDKNKIIENIKSSDANCLALERFEKGLELFSYDDRVKIYGAFCEYYYEIFDKKCRKNERNNAISNMKNDFIHITRFWGITDNERIGLFTENLRPLLERINQYKETKHIFFPKAGS